MSDSSLSGFSRNVRARWLSPRRVRFWLLVVVAAYTLVGFFVLPWLIHSIAVDTVADRSGHELQIEAVHTNPYTLTLRVEGLSLSGSDETPLVEWERLFANLAWSSVINRAWTVSEIHLDGLTVAEERFASGETRFTRLIEAFAGDAPAEPDAEPGELPALRITALRVEDAAVHFTDHLRDPAAAAGAEPDPIRLSVQDIALAVDELSLKAGERFPAQLQGQFAGGGGLTFDGMLQLLPSPALEGGARIEALALAPFEPYLRQIALVRVDSGTLSLDGTVRRDAQEPFAFRGTAGIESLGISEDSGSDTLLGWERLETDRLHLQLGQNRLESGAIRLDGLTGQVLIREDRTTNFGRLLVEDPQAEEQNDDTADTDPLAITVASIDLADGGFRFEDRSLPLPFAANIQDLSGRISTLSSESAAPARVELEGRVEDHGLVSISGDVHAWQPMRETDLALTFRNLRIPEYSAYTVRFAGRRIAAGTMDLDLDYTITDRQLDGSNKLVLRDLELGERMDSPDAMDLPLDMAIALLKGPNGVIDLDLPVSGNVGEPDFDIGQVIRQALGDAIRSVAQAPFRFLASLVGAEDEDLGRVEFLAGRSDLTPPQRERINTLREALEQRPALVLELAGPFDPAIDGPPLRRQAALEALRQRLAEAGREVDDPALADESVRDTVEAMFAAHYPDTNLADVRARFTEADGEAAGEETFDGLSYRNHLAERVIAAQPLTEAALKALGNARAAAVRDALTAPESGKGIAADRLRLLDPTGVDSDEGRRVAMQIGIATD